jgi:hypothetical protein
MRVFDGSQHAEIPAILAVAEGLTGDHFRLGEFGADRFPYDVVTSVARSSEESVPPGALARICKYQRDPRPGTRNRLISHFYRICLDDSQILDEAARSNLELGPLLLYVLTHELVHLVRFVRHRAPFEPYPHRRTEEEMLVRRKTYEILRHHRTSGLDAVLARFYPEE